jgi:enoyl-CoA hydratase/carnithine racemase
MQPVIPKVQGIATAAGCQLVATCYLAIAGEEAAFATPGVKIGLVCTTPTVALTRVIGRSALSKCCSSANWCMPEPPPSGPDPPGRPRR